jgi:hypothetical protein
MLWPYLAILRQHTIKNEIFHTVFFGEYHYCLKLTQIPVQDLLLLSSIVEVHKTVFSVTELSNLASFESQPMWDNLKEYCICISTYSENKF